MKKKINTSVRRLFFKFLRKLRIKSPMSVTLSNTDIFCSVLVMWYIFLLRVNKGPIYLLHKKPWGRGQAMRKLVEQSYMYKYYLLKQFYSEMQQSQFDVLRNFSFVYNEKKIILISEKLLINTYHHHLGFYDRQKMCV